MIFEFPATVPGLSSHVTTVPFSSSEALTVRVEVWQSPSLAVCCAVNGPHASSPGLDEWVTKIEPCEHSFDIIFHTV